VNLTGVLLVNLGTPDDPSRGSVYRYLKQFLLDPRVIDIPWLPRNLLVRGVIAPFRSGSSSKLYKKLWTEDGSPLLHYGKIVREKLQEALGDDHVVELGMRYQNPSLEGALERLRKKNVSSIKVIPLFTQYASASTGSVFEEVMRVLSKWQAIPELKIVNSFYNHPKVIETFVANAKKWPMEEYDHFVFSFHGIPHSQIKKADTNNHCLKNENCCQKITEKNQFCYSAQCYNTAQSIAAALDLTEDQYSVGFQSRLGPDPWTKPSTPTVLEGLANEGKKKLLVFSPAFVSDCLETIIEISDEYKEEFEEWGGEQLDLVESLNDNPLWIEGLEDIVRNL
jgi:ferrochelatase